MKKILASFVAVALLVIVMFVSVDAQSRRLLCGFFECPAFQDLVGLVTTVQSDVASISVIDHTEDIARLEAKIDQLLQAQSASQARLWLQDNSEFGMLPVNASQGEQLEIEMWIHGEVLMDFVAFGFILQFPDALLRLDTVERGAPLADWVSVDYNITAPGSAQVGGFAGTGSSIVGPAIAHLVTFKMTVIGGAAGSQAAVCTLGHVDGLADFSPSSFCATVNITN